MAREDEMQLPAWLEAALKVGIPGALAIGLTYWLTGSVDRRLASMEQQHLSMGEHNGRTEELTGRTYMVNEKILRVLTADCVNHATTAQARRDCVQ